MGMYYDHMPLCLYGKCNSFFLFVLIYLRSRRVLKLDASFRLLCHYSKKIRKSKLRAVAIGCEVPPRMNLFGTLRAVR